ncbi:unnamed protein product, partial [Allacma fusca]
PDKDAKDDKGSKAADSQATSSQGNGRKGGWHKNRFQRNKGKSNFHKNGNDGNKQDKLNDKGQKSDSKKFTFDRNKAKVNL